MWSAGNDIVLGLYGHSHRRATTRSTPAAEFSGWSPAGFPARSCSRAGAFGCIPTTCTRSARIAAASTSAGSPRRRTPTTDLARQPDEGLSYVRLESGQRFQLKEAVDVAGDALIGADVMSKQGGWNILCKFFDNMGPIPHHMHQSDAHAKLVGRKGKPEAYYFPPQYNQLDNNFPYTFMGLEPGTTKDDVRRCLENWSTGRQRHPEPVEGLPPARRQRLADRSRASCTRPARSSPTSRR